MPVAVDVRKNKFIKKYDIGHMNVDYEITDKGKKLLSNLIQIHDLIFD